MKKKTVLSILLAAALAVSLAGCAKTEKTEETPAPAAEPEQITQETARLNGGLTLTVPAEYADRVLVDTPENDPDGVLFSVSEKASVDAAAADGQDDWGAGWLFGISRISEEKLHEMLCWDMSGAEVFAKDAEGNYYLYTHPTDVRLYRQGEIDAASTEDWKELNAWAAKAADAFLAENTGLAAYTRGNSMLDIYLARTAYQQDANYVVSTTEYGPLTANGVDAAPYAERLMGYESMETAPLAETPDGEYVVLSFPDEDVRFDFFYAESNFVRMVWSGNEELLKLTYADDTEATAVMQEWYDALNAANGASPLVGSWAEKSAGLGLITITGSNGTYDVQIDWRSSAAEHYLWEMTATEQEDGSLRYENGRHVIRTFTSDTEYTDAEQYTNGTGTFTLNSANEIMWQDDVDHAGDDAVFISVD